MLRFLLRALVYTTGFCAGFVAGVVAVRERGALLCTYCGTTVARLREPSASQLMQMVDHAQVCKEHPLHEQCQPEPEPEPESAPVPEVVPQPTPVTVPSLHTQVQAQRRTWS